MAPVILQTGFENIKHSIPFTKGTLEKGAKLAFCHIKHIEEYVDDSVNNRLIAKCIRQTSVTETPYKLELEVSLYTFYHERIYVLLKLSSLLVFFFFLFRLIMKDM